MFESYYGNTQAIERLKAWVTSKTSTGVILVGRQGLGLKDLALETATNILGSKVDNHPDFVYVGSDDSDKIGVDEITEVIDKAYFAPIKSKINVAIIDGLDKATIQAQNKLLKTLEDAENLVIIAIAYSDRVLETIYSRMLRISFKPLSEAEFKAFYSGDDVDFAYALSRGCIEGLSDDLIGYYKPIAEAISIGEEKDFFRILHLIKEKDSESYYVARKNETRMLLNLLETSYMELYRFLTLNEVGKIALPEAIPEKEEVEKRLNLITQEKEKINFKSYTKDDFFLFICELVNIQ